MTAPSESTQAKEVAVFRLALLQRLQESRLPVESLALSRPDFRNPALMDESPEMPFAHAEILRRL